LISNSALAICMILVVACALFILWSYTRERKQELVKKLYRLLHMVFLAWPLALICMRFTAADNVRMLAVWDSCTYLGVCFAPVFMLMIAIVLSQNLEKLPRWCYLLLIMPVVTNLVVWTNPIHHLQYQVFSTVRSEIVFGPYIYVSGAYSYLTQLAAIILLLRSGIKNASGLYWKQVIVLILGSVVPLAVNCYATFFGSDVSIAATPASFLVTLVCHFVAIYRLHLLDIVPMATQHILDWISDGYMVLNSQGLVINSNRPFRQIIGNQYHIEENRLLSASLNEAEGESRTALYNLLSALENSGKTHSPVAYEQSVSVLKDDASVQKYYFMADITPLESNGHLEGFVVIFKDITQIRKSMQQVQESRARMMEQERLVLLGQMVGGLAHNLKTPIMSIAGCSSSIETLLVEGDSSLGDPEVTDEDYREIHDEIRGWLEKIRTSCSYMSDIINAVKGQAANANTTVRQDFTLDELLKRTRLLMRHELQSAGCTLVQESGEDLWLILHGDLNSMVQVLNNLVSNAIDASGDTENRVIGIGAELDDEKLSLYVRDHGTGIPPHVMAKLFQEMTTTKGTKGTGLGLYISGTVIRGKFGGQMLAENMPDGGAKIGFSIPVRNGDAVQVERKREVQV